MPRWSPTGASPTRPSGCNWRSASPSRLAAVRLFGPKIRWAFAAAALLCISVQIAHPFPPAIRPNALEMDAVDVGQGDSLFLTFPSGKTLLVDTGGIPQFGRTHKSNLDIGESVVSTYLWTRSIKRLDVVAITHAHEDHIGGLRAVLANFHPKATLDRRGAGVRRMAPHPQDGP